ncbi:adenylyl-sulfate kinase [Celerinatantimonas diazotrophica]|uniref:Adenylyl-sulfate kinase n=1 Tax=Celerinatantimonas diazotrophica TaxID=412034 RepID=A0A4R1JNK2_9GAMM|nr:adenylyl-sulfate kinase [Celerinatantimonas diazotrophica]TCK52099.1 adenylylsulfate kinase [Celerinatantimonas diazotrophica]CAG9296196.1 Adenylyl-sulfate kinase [Celerinatantimonas diazotrophica]
MKQVSQDVTWHQTSVSLEQRQQLNGHRSVLLWYTGLSGSGKSTIANAVDVKLYQLGVHSYVLDGDNVRHGLNGDLGFSNHDRVENIRRISEVAKLMVDAGLVVSTAFISPFIHDRVQARKLLGERFIEVFVDTPLSVCEARDPKGLYQKARGGEIKHFTGIDSAYEIPNSPEVHLKTDQYSIEQCAQQVVAALVEKQVISQSAL